MSVRSFDELGLTRSIIYSTENDLSVIDNKKIELLCNFFDVTADYFLGLSDNGIYVYHNDKRYILNHDDFIKYKNMNYIKYDGMKRILDSNLETRIKNSQIFLIEVVE